MPDTANVFSEELLAYLAGFFDGEGTINLLIVKQNTLHTTLLVGNTDPEPLQLFADTFGGKVACYETHSSDYPGHIYHWHVSGKTFERTLEALLPYLRNKRGQAEIALELRQSIERCRGKRPLPLHERLLRRELVDKAHDLKMKHRVATA